MCKNFSNLAFRIHPSTEFFDSKQANKTCNTVFYLFIPKTMALISSLLIAAAAVLASSSQAVQAHVHDDILDVHHFPEATLRYAGFNMDKHRLKKRSTLSQNTMAQHGDICGTRGVSPEGRAVISQLAASDHIESQKQATHERRLLHRRLRLHRRQNGNANGTANATGPTTVTAPVVSSTFRVPVHWLRICFKDALACNYSK
jgi:hypothetical protein